MTTELLAAAERDDPVGTVVDWLLERALDDTDAESVIGGCCDRLLDAGIPLCRVLVSFRTLHPLVSAISVLWQREKAVTSVDHLHGIAENTEEWRNSPFSHMLETNTFVMRRKLEGPDAQLDFPVLQERQAAGATDWLGCMVQFSSISQSGIIASWTTDRSGGFRDDEVQILLRIERYLAVVLKIAIREQIASNVLSAYLGPESGSRVLQGQIKRGDGEAIRAVVWYSDMRNSTAIASALPPSALLEVVNSYFECTAGAVLAAGGEVLQLIGDAVLAIFPVHDGADAEADACGRALTAATDALERRNVVRATAESPYLKTLSFGIGLHLGDLVYGNVGVPERVEFGVVGVAVNETARLQDLTKSIGMPVLTTAEVARHRPGDWRPLGAHCLRGVEAPHEVFGLPDPTPPNE
ncbi:MAG: adenylate cyclase [Rhodospirillaceae bacterium]|nr:adenylate cyclase [Rhodospirillaceae bacterium]